MSKKLLACVIVIVFALSIFGCGTSSEKAEKTIDIDITSLSGEMVHSEIENILSSPDDYVGKTIKLSGLFISSASQYSTGKPTDQVYYACMVIDQDDCCQRFVEFVPDASVKFLPKVGDSITIIGELQLYYNGQSKYCHLVNAEFMQ